MNFIQEDNNEDVSISNFLKSSMTCLTQIFDLHSLNKIQNFLNDFLKKKSKEVKETW